MQSIQLPPSIASKIGIDDWQKQCPIFEISSVTKKNWVEWCQHALEMMSRMESVLDLLQRTVLEELISTEAMMAKHIKEETSADPAPAPGVCPNDYPVLLPGDENVLQDKLDLWNRFQLAHGVIPTLSRLIISLGIVGGTIYGGLMFV
jgi:hypothetical protein